MFESDSFFCASIFVPTMENFQTLEQRVETLERELDAAIAAAARARNEKRQAEAAQRAAELRTQEITKELENTSSMSLK
jgi:exonuclease VII small subunit